MPMTCESVDREAVRCLITDTVTTLLKNSLSFHLQLQIQGLLGVTIDKSDVFLIHLNELCSSQPSSPSGALDDQRVAPDIGHNNIKEERHEEEENRKKDIFQSLSDDRSVEFEDVEDFPIADLDDGEIAGSNRRRIGSAIDFNHRSRGKPGFVEDPDYRPGCSFNTSYPKKSLSSSQGGNEEHFECAYCGKIFRRAKNLREHEPIHTGIYLYRCSICGKGTGNYANLKTHERIHTGLRPYPCTVPECGKWFKSQQSLDRHGLAHSTITDQPAVDPLTCTLCPTKCLNERVLRKHLQTHRERRYPCSYCGKVFRKIQILREHEPIHTGKYPYRCSTCGKGTGNRFNLRTHELTHKNDRPYSCDACGKTFKKPQDVKQHRLSHCVHRDRGTVEESRDSAQSAVGVS